jgi:uncharacterized membrane protein YjjB (DUF3815 family)
MVGLGVLSLISDLAGEKPVLVIVDDAQWLDTATAQSLGFVARRLGAEAAGLVFAVALITAVTAGLLIGLWLGRAQLTADAAGRGMPIWVDVPTAGLLAAAYGVFYGMPVRVLHWPFFVGAAAHAVRWTVVDQWKVEPWVGAGLACLFAGLVLVPVCGRWQLPFAAAGFASVVSLLPGVPIFSVLATLVQLPSATDMAGPQLLARTAASAGSAALVLLAMPLGFLVADAAWSHVAVTRSGRRRGAVPR